MLLNPPLPVGSPAPERAGRPRALPALATDRSFCRGDLPARMDCTLNLIDVRDVAEGLIRVMDRGAPGRRYLLGGENLPLLGLRETLSELPGAAVPRWRVPYGVGLAAAFWSEFWADHVTGR